MYNPVFFVLIGILLFGYVLGRILDRLNLKHILPVLPEELSDVFDPEEYQKSQLYKRDNTRFSFFTSSLGLTLMLVLFFSGGFGWLDGMIGNLELSYILHVLVFFGTLALLGDIQVSEIKTTHEGNIAFGSRPGHADCLVKVRCERFFRQDGQALLNHLEALFVAHHRWRGQQDSIGFDVLESRLQVLKQNILGR